MDVQSMDINEINQMGNLICQETGKSKWIINLGEDIRLEYTPYGSWYIYYNGCQMSFKDYTNQEKLIKYALRCINN